MCVISCIPILGVGGPKKYAAVSTDYDAATASKTLDGMLVRRGLNEYEGSVWWPTARSYNVFTFRDDGTLELYRTFDVHGSATNATAMATYLDSIPAGKLVLVTTHDEPMLNRLTAALVTAMRRCGAGPLYTSSGWENRAAYILFGKAGIGADAGAEYYHGTSLWFTFSTLDQKYLNILQR